MLISPATLLSLLTFGFQLGGPADESPQFAELFGEEAKAVAATASKQDDVDFATKLLTAVERLKDDPALQGTLCRKAYEAASRDPSGYALAVTALDRFASIYPDRKDYCDQTALVLLERQYKSARPAERRLRAQPYLQRLTSLADRKTESSDLDAALIHLRVAASVAGTGPEATSITAKITSVVDRQTVERKVLELRGKLAIDPNDAAALKSLIDIITVEKGGSKEVTTLLASVKDEKYAQLINAAFRPAEELAEEQAASVAEWWTGRIALSTSTGKARATKHAEMAWKRFLALHERQDGARLKAETALMRLGTSIAFANPSSTPRTSARPESAPLPDLDRGDTASSVLQIYNTHNWTYGDRGTRKCNVVLKLGTKVVWEQKAISLAWDESKKTNPKTTVNLPAVKYDAVRIEVVEWEGASGGLAEIEVIRNGKNVALHQSATASEIYNPEHREHCTAQMINDGIVDEAREGGDGKGYWLLPTGKPGWIEIVVGTAAKTDYPSIAGQWQEGPKEDGHRVFVVQNGDMFTATCTYQHKDGEVRWRMSGSISREGEIKGTLVHTKSPRNSWQNHTRTGRLSPTNGTIHGRAELQGGGGQDFEWKFLN